MANVFSIDSNRTIEFLRLMRGLETPPLEEEVVIGTVVKSNDFTS